MQNDTHLTLHETRGLFTKIYSSLSGKNGKYWEGVFNKALRKENPFHEEKEYHVTVFMNLIEAMGGTAKNGWKISMETFNKNKDLILDIVRGVNALNERYSKHPEYHYFKEALVKFDSANSLPDFVEACSFLCITGQQR